MQLIEDRANTGFFQMICTDLETILRSDHFSFALLVDSFAPNPGITLRCPFCAVIFASALFALNFCTVILRQPFTLNFCAKHRLARGSATCARTDLIVSCSGYILSQAHNRSFKCMSSGPSLFLFRQFFNLQNSNPGTKVFIDARQN